MPYDANGEWMDSAATVEEDDSVIGGLANVLSDWAWAASKGISGYIYNTTKSLGDQPTPTQTTQQATVAGVITQYKGLLFVGAVIVGVVMLVKAVNKK